MALTDRVTGTLSKFSIDSSGGGVYNVVSQQLDGTLTQEQEAIDATTKDDLKQARNLPGRRSWNASFTCTLDSAAGGDTDGQQLFWETVDAGGYLDFRVSVDGTADIYTGNGVPTNVTVNLPDNGAQNVSFSITGDGALVKS